MSRSVRITELAEEFKVNVGTISRALNGKTGVSEALRERIRRRAAEVNYQPNVFARALLTKRTGIIGVTGGAGERPLFENPFWGRILAGVEQSARAEGFDLLIGTSETLGPRGEKLPPPFITQRKVDGVITLNALPAKIFLAMEELSLPAVQIDFLEDTHYPSIVTDHVSGTETITNHLIDLGHRKLLFVGDPAAHPNFRLRQKGFLRAVTSGGVAGIVLDKNEAQAMHRGQQEYGEMLAAVFRREKAITGVVFQNDEAAIRCRELFVSSGWRIPNELSIVGFDDIEQAQEFVPPLTTMRVDKRRLGAEAFRRLFEAITHPRELPRKAQVFLFPAELIVRGTTAPPPRRSR